MANLEPSRPSRNTGTTKGKLRKRNGAHLRAPGVYFAEIQQTGWTPEIEADLFAAPSQLHIQPELMADLIADAAQRNDGKLWRLLACVNESKGEDHYAMTCATEALQLQPTDVMAMGVLARLSEKRQTEPEAADWHRRILEIDPTQVDSLRFLAHAHYQRGEYEPALQYWSQLIEAEPKVRTNKLYWLLSSVKNTGIHGLAQPLTDVRRWRTLTQEESPLAHELFLLVAKLCLQTRQRARAKQYLSRALQLHSTPEIEALLAEASGRSPIAATMPPERAVTTMPASTLPVKAPVAIPHPSGPIRLKYPMVPHPPVVLPEGAWNGRPRVTAVLTSGVGVIALMLLFAVVMIWSLPDDPNPSASLGAREKRAVLPAPSVVSSLSKEEVAVLDQKPTTPQTAPTVVAPPSPTVPSQTPVVVPPQPEAKTEAKKFEPSTPAQKNLTQPPAPIPPPKPEVQARPGLTQSTPAKPVADTAVQARVPASTPPAKELNQNALPVNAAKPDVQPRPTVTSPVPPKPVSASVSTERVAPPVPSPTPNAPAPQVVEKSLPTATVADAKERTFPVPPGNVNVHSSPSFYAPTSPESASPSLAPPVSTSAGASPPIPAPASPRVEKPKPLMPAASQPAVTKAAPKEKVDPPSTAEPIVASQDPKSVEEKKTHATNDNTTTKSEVGEPPVASARVESSEQLETPPQHEVGEPKTLASVVEPSRHLSPAAVEESQSPDVTETQTGEEERTAAVDRNTTDPQTEEAAIRSVRSATRLPNASRFPVRERLVSIPPEKLLLEMPELMRQETGASTVRKISPGVIRARLSGKPKDPARPPKEYGQYLVEIVPGPTEGTSRVRTQVLLFDWRTGDPIGDAHERADSLLKKIPDE